MWCGVGGFGGGFDGWMDGWMNGGGICTNGVEWMD